MGSDETAFLKGELGADGQPLEEERDEGDIARAKAIEALKRNRTWLGREWLTWLLWRSNRTEAFAEHDGEPLHVIFVGPVVLQGLAGDATELRAKGHQTAYAEVLRPAFAQGLLLHRATLRLAHGERVFDVTLDAEHMAIQSARIPKVLADEDEAQLEERMMLTDLLCSLVDTLWAVFVAVRSDAATWETREVAGLRAWLDEG